MHRVALLSLFILAAGCDCSAVATVGGADQHLHDGGSTSRSPDGGTIGVHPDAGSPCAQTCSDDLQSIVDCKGVATQCPTGQGCAPQGGCIDACQSAALAGSTVGCDFYVAAVPPQFQTTGSCYSAFVANTWNSPITITVQKGSTPLDISGFARVPRGSGASLSYDPLPVTNGVATLPVGQMAILFLAQFDTGGAEFFTPCPGGVTPAVASTFQLEGTGFGDAFHIATNAPVVAYDMYPYGGANSHVTSASLLIPTSAWGTNYLAADVGDPGQGGSPYTQIFSQQDGTKVAILAPVAIQGGGNVAGSSPNVVAQYVVNKGQVLQFEQSQPLSGALIKSDHPIAVWGGASCMNIPLNVAACDSAHQQLPAIPLLSSDYVAVRHRERLPGSNEPAAWRFIGAVDGTVLTYDPPQPGAPTTLAAGQSVELGLSGPFRVTSQDAAHVFYLAELMSGGQGYQGVGDPDFVTIVPPLQYLKQYLFFTDVTYSNTDLVIVRGPGSDGVFHDVTVDCAGVLSAWQPVGNSGFQYARVWWTSSATTGCQNGVHQAHSDAPFGLTVWGTDSYTSYGYAAGMSVHPINTVVVGPIIN